MKAVIFFLLVLCASPVSAQTETAVVWPGRYLIGFNQEAGSLSAASSYVYRYYLTDPEGKSLPPVIAPQVSCSIEPLPAVGLYLCYFEPQVLLPGTWTMRLTAGVAPQEGESESEQSEPLVFTVAPPIKPPSGLRTLPK